MSNKAIFLDCDGTLIEDPGYISNPDQVKLAGGVAEALIEFGAMGYKLIVASNQSAVARGIVTEEVLGKIHNRLEQLLAENRARLDKIYYCPYHPDGVIPKYRKESDWRKPNPGMLTAAADEMVIDLNRSWMIGNSSRDIEAGLRAGCKTILIDNSTHTHNKQPNPCLSLAGAKPDFEAVNIKEAVNIVKKHHRLSSKPTPTQPVLQNTEKPHQPKPTKPQMASPEQEIYEERDKELLSGILEQLKRMHRADMFSEFSTMKLMAGIVQIIALFCLLTSIWFLINPTRQDNSILIVLGFAMVLQLMALTFYIMQRRK